MWEATAGPSTPSSGAPWNQGSIRGEVLKAPDVAPIRPVAHAIGMCGAQLKELHESLGELERRLVSVLTPVPPSATGNGKGDPPPMRSELGERLDEVNVGIASARSRVVAILERLEV